MRKKARGRRLPVWVYLLINLVVWGTWQFTVGRTSPDLVKERLRPGAGGKEGVLALLTLFGSGTAHYLVAALDLGRFHWSDTVPFRAQIAGLIGFVASIGVVFWATAVNPFFSPLVRIQRERGHRVISTGPYRYVRHPGYLAGVVMLPCSGLALGSWWSMLPAMVFALALIRRTNLEDRVLREELEGYTAYAERVRYRLIPGIW